MGYLVLYIIFGSMFFISLLELLCNDNKLKKYCKKQHPVKVLFVMVLLSLLWPVVVLKNLIK